MKLLRPDFYPIEATEIRVGSIRLMI